MEAVARANHDAIGIFAAKATGRDDVCHLQPSFFDWRTCTGLGGSLSIGESGIVTWLAKENEKIPYLRNGRPVKRLMGRPMRLCYDGFEFNRIAETD
jgi:hypothetical protein